MIPETSNEFIRHGLDLSGKKEVNPLKRQKIVVKTKNI